MKYFLFSADMALFFCYLWSDSPVWPWLLVLLILPQLAYITIDAARELFPSFERKLLLWRWKRLDLLDTLLKKWIHAAAKETEDCLRRAKLEAYRRELEREAKK